jgi:hypothetical protein
MKSQAGNPLLVAAALVLWAHAASAVTFNACQNKRSKKIRPSSITTGAVTCKGKETAVSWNDLGPQGLPGTPGAPGTPATSLWASVADDGTLVRGSHVVNVSVSANQRVVEFDQAVSSCSVSATSVHDGFFSGEPHVVQAARAGASAPNQVFVLIEKSDGTAATLGREFDLQVFCSP